MASKKKTAKKKTTKKKAPTRKGPLKKVLAHKSVSDTEKKRIGKPPFEPTAEDRAKVEALVAYGINLRDICLEVINPRTENPISVNTLQKAFAAEIQRGRPRYQARVTQSLYEKALSKDHPQSHICAMFILKCQFGWRQESKVVHDVDGDTGVIIAPARIKPEDWVQNEENSNTKNRLDPSMN